MIGMKRISGGKAQSRRLILAAWLNAMMICLTLFSAAHCHMYSSQGRIQTFGKQKHLEEEQFDLV